MKWLYRCLWSAAIATLLTGCSLIPTYTAPVIHTPTQYKGLPSATDSSGLTADWGVAQPQDRRARGDWWTGFEDATLDALESQVDSGNEDIAAAAARYQQAHWLFLQARSATLPTATAVAYGDTDRQSAHRPLRSAAQPDSYHDDLVGGVLSYEIDLWGRVRSSVAAGSAGAQAARADLESVRLSLHAELARDYIALRAEDAQRQLLEQTVTAYGHALDVIRMRFSGGIASGLDVAQAQTQVDTARANLTDVLNRRALLENAIASLTGSVASDFAIAPGGLDMKLPDVPVGLPATLLERRPDIAAEERRMAAYNAQIGVARAAYFPRLSLAAIAGLQSTQSAQLFSAPNRFWAIGPQGMLPIFDHGLRSAVLGNAQAHLDEAAAHYREAVLRAFQEVEDSLVQQRLLGVELAQQQAARTAAERALQLATTRYEDGAVSYLQVVSTQITALQSQRATLDLHARQLQTTVALVTALGGGWQPTGVSSRPDSP